MAFKTLRLSERVSLIQETGVASCLRCNIWHVRGRDHDLVIDTGMGLDPLKDWLRCVTDRPIKAIVTKPFRSFRRPARIRLSSWPSRRGAYPCSPRK